MANIMMKGQALKYLNDYITENFPDKYDVWFEKLPPESKNFFKDVILSSNWYDLNFGHIVPIKILSELFYDSEELKTGYMLGQYGADKALSGIYKIFITIPTVDYVVKKVSTITSTYYNGGVKINVVEHNHKKLSLSIKGFYDGDELMIANISGWVDHLMSIILKREYEVNYTIESVPETDKIMGFVNVLF